jgi:hypothetical protein
MGAGSEKKYDKFKFKFTPNYDMPNFKQAMGVIHSLNIIIVLLSLGGMTLLFWIPDLKLDILKQFTSPAQLIIITLSPAMSAILLVTYIQKKIRIVFHLTDKDIERHFIEECKRWENELKEKFQKYCHDYKLEAVFIKYGTYEDDLVEMVVGGFSYHDDQSKKQEISNRFLFEKGDFIKTIGMNFE